MGLVRRILTVDPAITTLPVGDAVMEMATPKLTLTAATMGGGSLGGNWALCHRGINCTSKKKRKKKNLQTLNACKMQT